MPKGTYPRIAIEDRLLASCIPEPNSGCWLWTGPYATTGYGKTIYQKKHYNAHRLSHAVFKCDPGKLHVLHKCDVRECINPDHLWLGTAADNIRDMHAKGRGSKTRRVNGPSVQRGRDNYWAWGEKNTLAKLTENDVRRILTLEGPNVRIAEEYGVTGSLIGMIKSGKIWKHLHMSSLERAKRAGVTGAMTAKR